MEGNAEVMQITGALRAQRSVPHFLHGRNQESDQNRNNGNDNEELDQSEGAPA
jgi:hypothetical protein